MGEHKNRYSDTPTKDIEDGIALRRITDTVALGEAQLELRRRKDADDAKERAEDRALARKTHKWAIAATIFAVLSTIAAYAALFR